MALLDLIRPKWKNSNPDIRLNAVKEMDAGETDRLKGLAKTDEDTRVRVEAVKKISDEIFLNDLITENGSPEIQTAARHQLNLFYKEAVLNISDNDAGKALVPKITDETMLADISCEIEHQDIRLAAVERISDPALLCRITENNCGVKTADAVLERLEDAEHIKRVADHASNKKIRKKAQAKLDRMLKPVQSPAPEEIQSGQPAALCEQLETCRVGQNRVDAALILAKAKTKWEALSSGADSALTNRFEAAVSRIENEMAEFDTIRRTCDALDGICKELESPFAELPEDFSSFRETYEQQWNAVDQSMLQPNQSFEYNDRFQAAMKKAEARAAGRQAEKAERRQKLDGLEVLCSQAEEWVKCLQEDPPVHQHDAAWDELSKKWNDAFFDDPDAVLLKQRFQAASEEYRTRLETQKEDLKKAQAEEEETLKTLISTVEEAVTAEDRAKLDQVVRDVQQKWREGGSTIPDIKAGLEDAFQDACSRFFTAQRKHWENLEWERWANLNRKEELCKVMELVNENELIEGAGRIAWETRKKWREIGPVSRDKSDEIWTRFNTACDQVYRRALARKQEIFASLKTVTDIPEETGEPPVKWSENADQVKALQKQWNDIGTLPNNLEQSLREDFQSHCNAFFEKLRVFYRQLDDERQENLKQKTVLCEAAESLDDSTDWNKTAARLKSLQREWKKVGPVPRSDGDDLWNRFRNACNTFFDRMKAEEPQNLVQKEALCEQVETLLKEEIEEADIESVSRELMGLQREWKAIGPVPLDKADALWQRFQTPCDAFFMKRKEYLKKRDADQVENQQQKEALVEEAEALAESTEWKETGDRLKVLQQQWKEIGPAPRASEKTLWIQFQNACNHFFTSQKAFFEQKEQNRQENLKQKEQLCTSLEALARLVLPERVLAGHDTIPAAEQLRIALDYKNEIVVPGNSKETWERTITKVKAIQREWKTIGPVPYEKENMLWQRFRQGADVFFSNRSENSGSNGPKPDNNKEAAEDPQEQ